MQRCHKLLFVHKINYAIVEDKPALRTSSVYNKCICMVNTVPPDYILTLYSCSTYLWPRPVTSLVILSIIQQYHWFVVLNKEW